MESELITSSIFIGVGELLLGQGPTTIQVAQWVERNAAIIVDPSLTVCSIHSTKMMNDSH